MPFLEWKFNGIKSKVYSIPSRLVFILSLNFTWTSHRHLISFMVGANTHWKFNMRTEWTDELLEKFYYNLISPFPQYIWSIWRCIKQWQPIFTKLLQNNLLPLFFFFFAGQSLFMLQVKMYLCKYSGCILKFYLNKREVSLICVSVVFKTFAKECEKTWSCQWCLTVVLHPQQLLFVLLPQGVSVPQHGVKLLWLLLLHKPSGEHSWPPRNQSGVKVCGPVINTST